MTKKLYGDIFNRIYEGGTFTEDIKVGTGVTQYLYTDKYAYEVVEVISPNELVIRKCEATRIDDQSCPSTQKYEFKVKEYKETLCMSEEEAEYAKVRFNKIVKIGEPYKDNNVIIKKYKNGWREKGSKQHSPLFSVGIQEHYVDPHF